MIKTKYNFKQWLCRTYPDVIATPIYGLPAYILSKPLKPLHMHEYMIQQLANGQYIVFIGLNATQIERYIRNLNEEGIPHRRNGRQSICCPTTFSAFERWLARNNIRYNERVYVSNQTASEVLHIHHDDPLPEQAEAIFVAIGRIPATAVFKNLLDLDANGYIVAKEDCKTSTPGLFVAGDCRTKTIRQLITAAADGATAAEAAIDFLA